MKYWRQDAPALGLNSSSGLGLTDERTHPLMNEFMDQYQKLMELAPAGIFYTDLNGLCTYTNRAWQDIFQLSFKDALQSGWTHRLHPDESEELMKKWHRAIKNLEPIHTTCRLLLPDGQIRYIQADGNMVRNDAGTPKGYIGFVQDVSRSKMTEQQLQESEGRAHSIIEQSRIPYAVRGNQDEIAYLNPAFTNTFGYNLKDIPTSHDWFLKAYPNEIYRQNVLDRWEKNLNNLEHGDSNIEPMEVQVNCKDGSIKTVQLSPTRLHDSKGDKYAVSLYDVTEFKKIEQSLKESEERFTLAVNGSSVGIWDWDLRTGKVFYAKELKMEMGYQDHEFTNTGDAFYEHMHPDDIEGVKHAVAVHFNSDIIPYRVQYRMRHKNGDYQWYQAEGKALKDINGHAYRMAGSQINITEQMQTHERLSLANTVFEQSSEAILVTDSKGKIEAVNPAFSLLTGHDQGDVIGKSYLILNSKKNEQELILTIKDALINNACWAGEVWSRKKTGEDFAESIMINAVKDDKGATVRFIALFTDITDQKQTQELIWKQAHYDNLTQLLNRHSFTQYLQQAVKSQYPFSLLFIDLDHFKQINDTLGHKTGDELLIQAATRIKLCVRASDIVARFGGDEFTVILTGINNINSIKRISHDIIRHLAEPFKLNDENAYISASIGITQFPSDSIIVEDLYKYADQAMYDAKRLGRNRFSFFTQKMQDNANKQRKIGADLRMALELHQFKVLYQPIVNLKTGEIYKAEALIRWHHPEKGIISPADFIPIAEDTGLIIEIGDWVFKQAAMQAKVWRKRYSKNFQVSINKSPVQFYNANEGTENNWSLFLDTIHLTGNGITVEITEGLLLDSVNVVKDKIDDYHKAGMQISLDDFGTGYSALSYLKKFQIDFIKIDQSFVTNIETDSYDKILCETIISMAHKLGKKVIAEGIETEQQKAFLLNANCDYGQGYLFSRPITSDDLTQLLKEQDQAEKSE